MKKLIQIFVLLCPLTTAYAVQWDGKSPMWLAGACADKIKLSVMDKMSTADKYDVEYRVWVSSEETPYVATKSYTTNSSDAYAVFPDDFVYKKHPEIRAYPICTESLYWSIYANGRKISAGVITNEVTQSEVNGKLISTKGK